MVPPPPNDLPEISPYRALIKLVISTPECSKKSPSSAAIIAFLRFSGISSNFTISLFSVPKSPISSPSDE